MVPSKYYILLETTLALAPKDVTFSPHSMSFSLSFLFVNYYYYHHYFNISVSLLTLLMFFHAWSVLPPETNSYSSKIQGDPLT